MPKLLIFALSAIIIAVARGQLQTQCGANQVFLEQGVAPNCDTVCSEIGKPCTVNYIWPPSGCYCVPDHARDGNNVCVPISQCGITCYYYG